MRAARTCRAAALSDHARHEKGSPPAPPTAQPLRAPPTTLVARPEKPTRRTSFPAWNEEENLPAVLDELHAELPDTDVLVVDDGSTDGTAAVAREHGADGGLVRRQPGAARRNRRGLRAMPTSGICVLRAGRCGRAASGEGAARLLERVRGPCNVETGSRFVTGDGYGRTGTGRRRPDGSAPLCSAVDAFVLRRLFLRRDERDVRREREGAAGSRPAVNQRGAGGPGAPASPGGRPRVARSRSDASARERESKLQGKKAVSWCSRDRRDSSRSTGSGNGPRSGFGPGRRGPRVSACAGTAAQVCADRLGTPSRSPAAARRRLLRLGPTRRRRGEAELDAAWNGRGCGSSPTTPPAAPRATRSASRRPPAASTPPRSLS